MCLLRQTATAITFIAHDEILQRGTAVAMEMVDIAAIIVTAAVRGQQWYNQIFVLPFSLLHTFSSIK